MLIPLKVLNNKYLLNISGVIHVGAHYGEEIPDYHALKIAKVHLFEPLKENFQILQKNILKYNKEIEFQSYCFALGNFEGKTKMFLSSNNLESSSILKPEKHLIEHPEVKFLSERKIKIMKLDQLNINDSNFLNMDVQGYELEVLKGAKKSLVNIDYIYCEINRSNTYENNAYIDEIDIFLSKYNFVRCETMWAGDDISWGDAFYIKKDKFKKNKIYSIFALIYSITNFFKKNIKKFIKNTYRLIRKRPRN